MDAVLGLSMTPTSVGMVLVNGGDDEGAEGGAFRLQDEDIHTSAQATAAVLRTEAEAANRGVRLHSIGVTWSEDADAEASLLIRSLSESGFDNVVAIRLPEATEALARGIADVIGYETTAVCVIEPDVVITLIVHTRDGAIQTAINHSVHSGESLVGWLSSVFTKADWQPEALVVVGSAGDFESILPRLESALSVPTFTPEDAQLALARGAALASAHNIDFPLIDLVDTSTPRERPRDRERRRAAQTGPLAVLIVAVVTFVVSATIAITLQVSPHEDSGTTVGPASAAVPAAEPKSPSPTSRPPAPAAVRAVAPPEELPPPVEAAPPPPPEAPVVEEVVPEAPAPAVTPGVDEVPAVVPPPPAVTPPGVDPAAIAPVQDPNAPASTVPPIPTTKPPLHSRIMDRIRGIGNN